MSSHQSQATQDTQAINQLKYYIQQARSNDKKVENVPSAKKKIFRKSH